LSTVTHIDRRIGRPEPRKISEKVCGNGFRNRRFWGLRTTKIGAIERTRPDGRIPTAHNAQGPLANQPRGTVRRRATCGGIRAHPTVCGSRPHPIPPLLANRPRGVPRAGTRTWDRVRARREPCAPVFPPTRGSSSGVPEPLRDACEHSSVFTRSASVLHHDVGAGYARESSRLRRNTAGRGERPQTGVEYEMHHTPQLNRPGPLSWRGSTGKSANQGQSTACPRS
jgi:hypothetical protein